MQLQSLPEWRNLCGPLQWVLLPVPSSLEGQLYMVSYNYNPKTHRYICANSDPDWLSPWSFQGAFCDVDVNECAEYAGTDLGCQNGATCVNNPGSFT